MKCFYGDDKDPIAVCKKCGEALCEDHLLETKNGIVCGIGECEKRLAEEINNGGIMIDKQAILKKTAYVIGFIFVFQVLLSWSDFAGKKFPIYSPMEHAFCAMQGKDYIKIEERFSHFFSDALGTYRCVENQREYMPL